MKPRKKALKRLQKRIFFFDQTMAYLRHQPGYTFFNQAAWKRPGSEKK